MRAILELALEYGKAPLQIKTIAAREDISNKYLEQLIAMLKASGLVRSIRGPRGGYMLAKPPAEIQLKDVFLTLEGPMVPAECLEHPEYCPLDLPASIVAFKTITENCSALWKISPGKGGGQDSSVSGHW